MKSQAMRSIVLPCAALLIALILAGCGSTPQATPAPIPTVTAPTQTSAPSTATTTLALKPTAIQAQPVTATSEATSAATDVYASCESVLYQETSPDSNWDSVSCNYTRENAKLIVTGKNGKTWEMALKDYLLPDPQGFQPGALHQKHWSKDGKYLFFSSNLAWDGGGTCFYGFGAQGLFRLSLETGKVSTVLGLLSSNDTDGYKIAFSPTGRRFVYSKEEDSFTIVDLTTGQESVIQTGESTDSFTWSPDGSALAFSSSLCNYDPQEVIHSRIKIVSMADLSTKTVAQSDTDFLRIEAWPESNLMTLIVDNLTDSITTFSIDPNQSVIVPPLIKATPTPDFAMTQTAYPTLKALFPDCIYMYTPDSTFSTSPDHQWTIAKCLELTLRDENGKMIKIPASSFSSFFGPGVEYQELHAQPEYWSQDGGSLYFSAQAYTGDGCGCFCYGDGLALFRLDISSEKITPILLQKNYGNFSFAFSPNGKQLAYTDSNNQDGFFGNKRLIIRDLKTGKESVKLLDQYSEIGNLVWSPDGTKLALGMAFCPDTTYPTFNLGVINMNAGLSPKIILTKAGSDVNSQAYYWHIDAWRDDNVIVLTGLESHSIQVNLSGLQPIIVTGTPEP